MVTSWTNLNKPTGTSWTGIPKPSGIIVSSLVSFIGGTPIGLLLSLTQSSVIGISSVVTDKWTDIPKATATTWTNIPKGT